MIAAVRLVVVALAAAVLLVFPSRGRTDPVSVPGPWCDQEKYNDPNNGLTRYGNYYQDLDSNGEYTLGEPCAEYLPTPGDDADHDWRIDSAENWGIWKWNQPNEQYYEDTNSNGQCDPGEATSCHASVGIGQSLVAG